ncbi:MAG: DUF4345 family protein [Leptospiraceae bacterium]|nr:DUF4345 family protein [Leptospiraceae bacterium]
MDMILFNQIGASITTLLGLMGFLAPKLAMKFTGLSSSTKEGSSEFRATFGGLFIALGLFPLWIGNPQGYLLVGLAWIATGIGRAVSIVADSCFTSKNVLAVFFESGIGCLLILGNCSIL